MSEKRYFVINRPLSPNEDGKKFLTLKVGEYFLMAYPNDERPSGPGQIGLGGRVFEIEPLPICMKITRIK